MSSQREMLNLLHIAPPIAGITSDIISYRQAQVARKCWLGLWSNRVAHVLIDKTEVHPRVGYRFYHKI
jgi:hypothetical protein